MKSLMLFWVVMVTFVSFSPVNATDRGQRNDFPSERSSSTPNPKGNAYGHDNPKNPHYVAEEEVSELPEICPTLSSAPHLCVNYD